jgi:hypothetical protein
MELDGEPGKREGGGNTMGRCTAMSIFDAFGARVLAQLPRKQTQALSLNDLFAPRLPENLDSVSNRASIAFRVSSCSHRAKRRY